MYKQIITCSGYGSTGSSSVTDYISEFLDVNSLGAQVEFQLLSEPNGIYDLENAITSGNQLLADNGICNFLIFLDKFVKRFPILQNDKVSIICNEYLSNLHILKWNGGWYGSQIPHKKYLKPFFYYSNIYFSYETNKNGYSLFEPDTCPWRPHYTLPCIQYYSFLSKEEFYLHTKTFFSQIINYLNKDNKENIMIDHLFPPSQIKQCQNYIDNVKTICVDRDPVDLYIQNKFFQGERWLPTKNVDLYIEWYKLTRKHREIDNNTNYLFIKFEDLIYNYDRTSNLINNFVNFDEKSHINKYKYFDPRKSIVNTNMYERYDCNKIDEDITKIRKELNIYLYNFPKIGDEKKEVKKTIELIYNDTDILFNKRSFIYICNVNLLYNINNMKYLFNQKKYIDFIKCLAKFPVKIIISFFKILYVKSKRRSSK